MNQAIPLAGWSVVPSSLLLSPLLLKKKKMKMIMTRWRKNAVAQQGRGAVMVQDDALDSMKKKDTDEELPWLRVAVSRKGKL